MNKKGFTLMELMVVILIIAVLASVAIPFYNDAIDSQNNARAKAILETINVGLERFDREYGVLTTNYALDFNNNTILVPPANTVCTYHGQPIDENFTVDQLIAQLIACGYIPRSNYGTTTLTQNGTLDYKFRLQHPNNAVCGVGYVYMEPKTDAQNQIKVGTKYCLRPNNDADDTTCHYCAGINPEGKAMDLTK